MSTWQNIISSFKANAEGLSGRKLTAFVIVVMVVCLHAMFIYALQQNQVWAHGCFIELVIIDFISSAFFLGLVTVQQIIELKNGNVIKSSTVIEKSETVTKETEVK